MSDIRFNRWLHQSGTGGVSQDSSGNIGIGTTVPTMALDVRGDVNIGNAININNASGIISATTFTGTTGTFSGNVSAVDGTFTGNVSIGGTLTYEDVSNIDAVGIITAQKDVLIGRNLNVTGVSTFNNDVKLLDNDKLKFGIGEDLQIYHNGSHSIIHDSGEGNLRILAGHLDIKDALGNNHMIVAHNGAAVTLYHNGSEKFATTDTGATVTGILTATSSITGSNYEIAGISSSISDTAVDVFVYDTRKDSDGGAWRKRTQHTSWYNETLNTSTRGSRKEFPAVAVLVLEAGKLTIYDGDDPDLPMWMVFNNTGSNVSIFGRSLSTRTSVEMLNGLLVISGSYSGAHFEAFTHINFISEKCQQTNNTGTVVFHKNISQRGETSTYSSDTSSFTIVNIVSVNDVAMTVLPNAPIDDTTGLPVPTIAVGTNGGVSVIKDNNTVISTSGSSYIHKVEFTNDHGLNAIISNTSGANWACVYVNDIDTLNGLNYGTYNNWDGVVYRTKYDPKALTYKTASTNDTISGFIDLENRSSAISVPAIGGGLTLFEKSPKESFDPDGGMVAFITTDYNTGYLHGDIEGAFLSDTDTTNVTGSEKLANYDFAADFSTQWEVANNANTSYDATNDRVTVTSTQNYSGIQLKSASLPTLTAGKRYIMTVDIHSITNPIYFGVVSGLTVSNVNSAGVWTGVFTASNVTEVFIKKPTGSNSTFVLNSVSIREAEEDRSVNNKGLQVFGTVTKSAVATGAELVAYSGWSASNYLLQPYNPDLAPGTGAYSVTCWFKTGTSTGDQYIFDRSSGSSGSRNLLLIMHSNAGGNSASKLQWWHRDSSGNYTDIHITDKTVTDNVWHQVVALYDGSSYMVYVDGSVSSVTSSVGRNVGNDGTPAMYVGVRHSETAPMLGKLALFRYSRSAPSPEQIKKIYEDEKHFFQENAKATLYGSSDAVTALGYDEDTELLHIGTSSGRSDFQGLCRINNTTTAVTTAISASDDLIAEQ